MDLHAIPGLDGYFVTKEGRVYSDHRKGIRELKQRLSKFGYPRVRISMNGRRIPVHVHKLVLETFVGHCPPGMQCRHLDGDRTNARLGNLAWGTPQENADDRVSHGNVPVGTRHAKSRYTEEQILEMRRRWNGGATYRDIMKEFGGSKSAVISACNGKTWAHINDASAPAMLKGCNERPVEAFGESKSINEWARDPRCVVKKTRLAVRLDSGMQPEEAITRPRYATYRAFGEFKKLEEWAKDPRCLIGYHGLRKRLAAGMDLETAMGKPSWFEGRSKRASSEDN